MTRECLHAWRKIAFNSFSSTSDLESRSSTLICRDASIALGGWALDWAPARRLRLSTKYIENLYVLVVGIHAIATYQIRIMEHDLLPRTTMNCRRAMFSLRNWWSIVMFTDMPNTNFEKIILLLENNTKV